MNDKSYVGPSVNPVLDSILANDPMHKALNDAKEQLLLKDRKIDHLTQQGIESDSECESLRQQLAAEQLRNERLREALDKSRNALVQWHLPENRYSAIESIDAAIAASKEAGK